MRPAGSSVRGLGLTACLAALALAPAPVAAAQDAERPPPPPVPVADDDLTAALEGGELTEAEYALERARSVFQLARVRREFGEVARPAARDTTMILRDLAARLSQLSGPDRVVGRALLARPTGGGVPIGHGYSVPSQFTCGAAMCFHWVASTPDAAAPDWVSTVQQTWEEVWEAEIGSLGYREPQRDGSSNQTDGPVGPDKGKLDVYILDLGQDAVFGYCASLTDDLTTPVYCAVDNDYAPEQYGATQTPEGFLQVTAAHEFHHASQAAYDFWEDYWLIEGTAANIEESVYPAIDDNVGFLSFWSPLSRPSSPLDRGGFGNSEYGSWIFWRFLEEKIAAGDPDILREIWERADASPLAAFGDQYSLQAVRTALTERGHVFADIFAQFGRANRLLDYADAGSAGYPALPLTEKWSLGRNNPTTGRRSWTIKHLAARYFSFVPGSSATLDGNLAIRLELPRHGARATVIVVEADGSTVTHYLRPNEDGFARKVVRFGRGEVRRVDLVLSNGSTRTACWRDRVFPPFFSCFGRPRDDGRAFELRARSLP